MPIRHFPAKKNWCRVMAATIGHMTPERARESLRMITARGNTIDQPEIRRITGGYSSQAILSAVTRRLAAQAGMIPRKSG